MNRPSLTLTIEKLNSSGAGLARHEGKVYFVPFTVPGDIVITEVVADHKNYADARVVEIVQKSPDRIDPRCPHFSICGGCDLQMMDYESQLHSKKIIIEDILKKIARIQNPCVEDVLPSPDEWHYRNRIQVHVDKEGKVGFYKFQSHQVVEFETCLIADDILNQKTRALRQLNQSPKTTIELRLDGEAAFSQVNTLQNKNMVSIVLDFLEPGPNDHVADVFCGSGNFSFPLASRVKQVFAIEKDARAINGAINRFKNISNIDWRQSSAKAGLWALKNEKLKIDKIVLDPPREGLVDVIAPLMALNPQTIVYVSCNPATFARDVNSLMQSGYELTKCQPLDMFPQTAHVELVGLLVKKEHTS